MMGGILLQQQQNKYKRGEPCKMLIQELLILIQQGALAGSLYTLTLLLLLKVIFKRRIGPTIRMSDPI